MRNLVKSINYALSERYAERFILKQPYLLGVYLHKIYPDRKSVNHQNGSVNEGVTQADFERFVAYFKNHGFTFVDETDILEGRLERTKRNLYLTFDDGYYNNLHALPILEKYGAKATFYIVSAHCQEQKAYWWDVLAKERSEQKNFNTAALKEEVQLFYQMSWQEQDDYIRSEFGADALNCSNDLMRPMDPKELKAFAQHQSVTIGNHTTHHHNITNYPKAELLDAVRQATTFLEDLLEQPIRSIAYPYGFHSDESIETVTETGLEVGLTTVTGKQEVAQLDPMRIKRNQLSGFYDIEGQCRVLHHNFSMIQMIKRSAI